MKHYAVLLVVLFVVLPVSSQEFLKLCGNTELCFADVEMAKSLVGQRDEYIEALSSADCQLLCQKKEGSTKEECIVALQSHILPWEDRDKLPVYEAVNLHKEVLETLKLNLPPVIHLIKTDEKYGSMAYTRMSLIIFSQSILFAERFVRHVFPHEIFHVYSRTNPEVSKKLYRLIGFENRGPLMLPEDLTSRRLTNPDYPQDLRYSIEVKRDIYIDSPNGPETTVWEKVLVFPLVIVPRGELDLNRPLINYITRGFGLLVVEKKGDFFVPKLENGQEVMLDPLGIETNFYELTRANTLYVAGPEEIMAENFFLLVNNANNDVHKRKILILRPSVLKEMQEVMAGL